MSEYKKSIDIKKILRGSKDFFNAIKTFFYRSFIDIIRDRKIVIVSTVILVVIIFLFNTIFYISRFSEIVLYNINNNFDIKIEINKDTDEYLILDLVKELKRKDGVKTVYYISKDSALDKFKERFKGSRLIDFFEGANNPLPASIRVVSTEISKISKIIDYIAQSKYQSIINLNDFDENYKQKDIFDKFKEIWEFIKISNISILILFLVVTVLVIYSVIYIIIYNNRLEIKIMWLVGARELFIKLPFIVETVFISIISGLISSLIILFVVLYLDDTVILLFGNYISSITEFITYFYNNFFFYLLVEILVLSIISFLSAVLVLKKYDE